MASTDVVAGCRSIGITARTARTARTIKADDCQALTHDKDTTGQARQTVPCSMDCKFNFMCTYMRVYVYVCVYVYVYVYINI